MAGSVEGGKKAYQTTLKRRGSAFIKQRNSRAGRIGRTGGFYNNPEGASLAAKKSWENRRKKI